MDDLDHGETIVGLKAGQQVFRRFTLERLIGRGGMAQVWQAKDDTLGTPVALKFLRQLVVTDRSALNELVKEVRRSRELTHPHIVRVNDFHHEGAIAGISMELVEGDTLANLRIDQPGEAFAPDQLAPWVEQLAAALDYAHADVRIVHRDIKPSNLMVDARGRLKVADFGIARSLSDSLSRLSNTPSSGTLLYMSPQQLVGDDPTPADDLYALGATLYELLTGKPPFHTGDIAGQVKGKQPASVNDRRAAAGLAPVPADWNDTILALLAKNPADRPASAGAVAERLGLAAKNTKSAKTETVERGGPTRAEPVRRLDSTPTSKIPLYAGLAAAVVLLGGLGYYFGVHAPEQRRLAEISRLEAEGRAAEALKLKNEQERALAEQQAKNEQARLAAERLAAARGGIVIRTNPPGAEVRVGAVALDKSPLTLKDQKLGKYPVRVRLDGYEDWTGEVEVKENEFSDLDVALVRSTGTLVVTSSPSGAAIVQDGKELGRTPFNSRAELGRYRLSLQLKGYKSAEVAGEVVRNSELKLTAELEKDRGPKAGQTWTIPELNLTMQPIAPGSFTMGTPSGGYETERPVTSVRITEPFWLGRTEVAQAQWEAVMGNNPSNLKAADRPVENVSWDDAMAFCRKLTERERAAGRLPAGYAYTLPTEAQWEYACRAATTGDYAGSLDAMAWYDNNSGGTTHPVAQKQANAWGLSDMHGNVWEWCLDWYGNYPGGSVTDPVGAPSGFLRVLRGGSWDFPAPHCRSASRYWRDSGNRWFNLGFRLALSSIP